MEGEEKKGKEKAERKRRDGPSLGLFFPTLFFF